MGKLRRTFAAAAVVAILAGSGYLAAQPSDDDDDDADVTLPGEQEANLTPREMTVKAEELIDEMKGMLRRVVQLQQSARSQKDVIKLNCVNDKLLQVKQLLNIAESSNNNLVEAIAASNEGDRYHQFSQISISHEKVSVLRDEAEACIGEELIFLGPTEVDVDKPPIVDDPTTEDPFDISGDDVRIERPGYSTPFF